jgi:hypothetical protein
MRKWVIGLLLIVGAVVLPAGPAWAGCHAWTVSVSPDTVTEGGTVTVKVTRDGAVNPSQVDISTVDESAHAPDDYTAASQTLKYTIETAQTFTVATVDDGTAGGPKTFRLHLSNPGGCAVNPNYVLGPDARVTINDNGAAVTSPATSPASTSADSTETGVTTSTAETQPSTASSTAASTTTASAASSAAPSTSRSTTGQAAAKTSGGGGSSSGPIVAIVIAILVVASGAGYALLRRRSANAP